MQMLGTCPNLAQMSMLRQTTQLGLYQGSLSPSSPCAPLLIQGKSHPQPDGSTHLPIHDATGQLPKGTDPKRTPLHRPSGPKSTPASKTDTTEGRSRGAVNVAADATTASQASPDAASPSLRNAGGVLSIEGALAVCAALPKISAFTTPA